MRARSARARSPTSRNGAPPRAPRPRSTEAHAPSRWLADDHFTFLGYREYELTERGRRGRTRAPSPAPGSGSCATPAATGLAELREAAAGGAATRARAGAARPSRKANSALDRAPARLPRLHRRQAVRRGRRASSASGASSGCTRPRPTARRRARSRSCAARCEPVLRARGLPPAEPRGQGAPRRSSRPTRGTSSSRSGVDDLVRDRDGDPRPQERQRRPAVRAPRHLRSVLLLPRLRAARPLHHRGPRSGSRRSCSTAFGGASVE